MKRKEEAQNLMQEQVEVGAEKKGKKGKKRKKWPFVLGGMVVLAAGGMYLAGSQAAAGFPVTVQTPIRGDIQESINTSGTISSEDTKTYFSQIAGILGEVKVKAGDAVKAGDVLVTYDADQAAYVFEQASLQKTVSNSTYQSAMEENGKSANKLQEATVNLEVLERQIKDYEAYLKTLQQNLSKSQRDTSNGLAAESYTLAGRQADLQAKINGIKGEGNKTLTEEENRTLAELTAQLQEVVQAQSRNTYLQSVANSTDYTAKMQEEIKRVEEELAACKTYKAEMQGQKESSEAKSLNQYQKAQSNATNQIANVTFELAKKDYETAKQGIVAAFDGVVTECSATQGASVVTGAQLLTLASTESVKVSFSASKYDMEKLELGQKAKVKAAGQVYDAEVSKIDRVATKGSSGTALVGVEVRIANPDERIILGMDAKLEVLTHKAENVLMIPVEAINSDKDGDFLYVAENGLAVRKNIVTGISSDTYIEIKEGISENDQIIISSEMALEEGMPVAPAKGTGTEGAKTETTQAESSKTETTQAESTEK